jgi:hypothetical protein
VSHCLPVLVVVFIVILRVLDVEQDATGKLLGVAVVEVETEAREPGVDLDVFEVILVQRLFDADRVEVLPEDLVVVGAVDAGDALAQGRACRPRGGPASAAPRGRGCRRQPP